MPDVMIPNRTGDPYLMTAIDQQVRIGGVRRTDAVCLEIVLQSGASPGYATISFQKTGSAQGKAWELYDAWLATENDLVEIVIKPYGVIWRGYITARDTRDATGLTYTALDIITKLAGVYFPHKYNYEDEVTRQIKYPYTMRQIAGDAWGLYAWWWAQNQAGGITDYALTLDLNSFPDTRPTRDAIDVGMNLLDGLAAGLASVDYRYRLRVIHTGAGSVVSAYKLGEGYPKNLARGTDATKGYHQQPGGMATLSQAGKSVNAANTITRVYAEGENRIIETALELTQSWNEVANDFTPPAGSMIKDFVTVAERDLAINNWEKYTKERLDIKREDHYAATILNPNYRKKFERVGTHYRIPAIDDFYYYNDDPNNYPTVYGEAGREVKLESKLVQSFDGKEVQLFLVMMRAKATPEEIDYYYIKRDGFSIQAQRVAAADGAFLDHNEVVFSKPFVDSVSNVVSRGINGAFVVGTWNAGEGKSQYANVDLNYVTSDLIAAGLWLVLGEYMAYYKINDSTSTTVTVNGNLTNAGIGDAKGKHWFITTAEPPIIDDLDFAAGTGGPNGRYEYNAGGSEMLNNDYAGCWLILGARDGASFSFSTAPADLKVYRISTNSGRYFWIDNLETDLTGFSVYWQVAKFPLETKRPFEHIWLNVAYRSLQKLAWDSGDASGVMNKRIIYKQNSQFKWTTEKNNFQLVKSATPGEEDKYTLAYNDQTVNHLCEQAGLAAWAANQIQGATDYEAQFTLVSGFLDFAINLGDRLLDTGVVTTASVAGIRYDLANPQMTIQALSWGG